MFGRLSTQARRGRVTAASGLVLDNHHRDLSGGGLRAAIFGVSDGLVSNVSLILGSNGAHVGGQFIRLAGIAGLLGGAFSMAAGEYVSMRAQREAFEHELEVERRELAENPIGEQKELETIYVRRGVDPGLAQEMSREIMADPDVALVTHAHEELGIDPAAFGSPIEAAVSSFVAFTLGAFVPLAPFLTGRSSGLVVGLAVGLTGLAALGVGFSLAHFTGRSHLRSALRSLLICAAAGSITFGVGSLIGVAH